MGFLLLLSKSFQGRREENYGAINLGVIIMNQKSFTSRAKTRIEFTNLTSKTHLESEEREKQKFNPLISIGLSLDWMRSPRSPRYFKNLRERLGKANGRQRGKGKETRISGSLSISVESEAEDLEY